MADDPSSAAPEKNSTTIRRANVGVAKVGDAQFSRADIQTGEIKSIEGDILSEIHASIEEQTATLGAVFREEIKECCKAAGGGIDKKSGQEITKSIETMTAAVRALGPQLAMGGGGGGGGGDGGPVDPGTMARARRMQALSEVLEDLGQSVDEAGNTTFRLTHTMDELESQLRENLNETIRDLNATMIRAMGSFTRFQNFTDEVTDRFRKGLDMASSGLLDFTDLYVEDTLKVLSLGFKESGDSLVETAEQVRKAVDEGITSPMRLVQGNVRDVAMEFKRLRGEAEDFGLDLYARIGWREQNELLLQLIDEQRRGSLRDDFRSQETRQNAMKQLNFLSIVADNTGQSLEQLIAMNKEQARSFEELQGLGILSEEQANTFKQMAKAAPPEVKEFLQKIAEAGGSTAVFAKKFPDLFEDLTKLGQQDLIQRMAELSESGLTGVELINTMTKELQGGLGNIAGTFGKEAAAIMFQGRDIQGLSGAVRQMATFQENMGRQSPFFRMFNEWADKLTNTWPIQWAKSIGALTFNTAAIVANTAAHLASAGLFSSGFKGMKGALGRVFGRRPAAPKPGSKGFMGPMPAKGGGFMKGAGNLLKGASRIGGSALGGLMVGKDIVDLIGGDTSGENVGALAGSGIGALIGGGIGAFFGGVGAVPGAAIGAGVGNWIGELAGGAMSPGTGTDKPMKPSSTSTKSKSPGQQQAVASNISRQTELLASIALKMDRSIQVQSDIASGIGRIGLETGKVSTGIGAKTAGNRPLFAESPSMGG